MLGVANRMQFGLDGEPMRAADHAVEAAWDRERERAWRALVVGRVRPVREGAYLAERGVGDRVSTAALQTASRVSEREKRLTPHRS